MAEQPGWSGAFDLGAKLFNEKLSASLKHVRFVPDDSVRVDQLRADYMGAQRVRGRSGLARRASRALQAALRRQRAEARRASPNTSWTATCRGRIELVGGVKGELDKPALEARLRWMNGPQFAKHESETRAVHQGRHRERPRQRRPASQRGQGAREHEARVALAQRSAAGSGGEERPDRRRRSRRAASRSKRSPAASDRPPPIGMRGLLSGQLEAHGNMKDFKLDTRWQADVRAGRDPNALAIALHANYDEGQGRWSSSTPTISSGGCSTSSYHHELDVPQLMAASKPLAELVQQTVWEATRQVPEAPRARPAAGARAGPRPRPRAAHDQRPR